MGDGGGLAERPPKVLRNNRLCDIGADSSSAVGVSAVSSKNVGGLRSGGGPEGLFGGGIVQSCRLRLGNARLTHPNRALWRRRRVYEVTRALRRLPFSATFLRSSGFLAPLQRTYPYMPMPAPTRASRARSGRGRRPTTRRTPMLACRRRLLDRTMSPKRKRTKSEALNPKRDPKP